MKLPASLKLDQVSICLDGKVLVGIDCEIAPGKTLTLMGPSGSGKSSLLAFLGGFLDPVFETSGSAWLGDTEITSLPAEHRRVGLMFQDPLLFPHMSVAQNLAFALSRETAAGRQERQKRVEEALVEAGMPGFGDRDPATLSGGQQSRIALMRVLLARPRALLLDEPFSRLDRSRRAHMREFVFSEARKHDLPVLLVTHDHEDAEAASGHVIELEG